MVDSENKPEIVLSPGNGRTGRPIGNSEEQDRVWNRSATVASLVSSILGTVLTICLTIGAPLYNMNVTVRLMDARIATLERKDAQWEEMVRQRNEQIATMQTTQARQGEKIDMVLQMLRDMQAQAQKGK